MFTTFHIFFRNLFMTYSGLLGLVQKNSTSWSWPAQVLFIWELLVPDLFIIVHNLFKTFHDLFTTRSQLVHDLFMFYSHNFLHLIHDLFKTCSFENYVFMTRLGHNLFMTCHNPFATCLWLVHNLTCLQIGMTYSQIVHDLLTNCPPLVHNLFTTC